MPDVSDRLRLTVLGCSTAAPDPGSPAAGFLVEWGDTAVLFDAGQGVVPRLQAVLDPHRLAAVVIGHMHADHYLDLAGLRYLFPWGDVAPRRLPVHLPPGGRRRLDALADGDLRTARVLRRGLRRARIRPRGRSPDRAAVDPFPSGPPLRARPGASRSTHPMAHDSPTRATPGPARRWPSSPEAPTCCSSRPLSGMRATTTTAAAI